MKKTILLLAILSLPAFQLWSQTSQTNQTVRPTPVAQTTQTNLTTLHTEAVLPKAATTYQLVPVPGTTNILARRPITYSGAFVQVYKTDNLLQLVNPFAPASYGSGYDNLSIDPITKRPQGIALFSINF